MVKLSQPKYECVLVCVCGRLWRLTALAALRPKDRLLYRKWVARSGLKLEADFFAKRLYHWLPKNWPEGKIVYTSSIIWKDACVDLYQKYQEHSTLGECTQVKIGAGGRAGLFARLDLPATCLLERYVGEVIDGAEFARQPRNDLHVFLYDYGAGKLYIDSNTTGSLTRFIRKVEPEDADINCVIIPINLDGAWQLFVELQREIKARV